MLIIYGALSLGGIETFITRLAKERFLKGKKTKVLLLIPPYLVKYDSDLYEKLCRYAEIFYFKDVFEKISLNRRFFLLHKLNLKNLKSILEDCRQIHVSDSQYGLLANEILKQLDLAIPITIGVYHTMEFSWGNINDLPYFERVNRKFIYDIIDSSNLICFSQKTKEILESRNNIKLVNAQTFRLGVIESIDVNLKENKNCYDSIRICAVGRLTDFKTYNYWMPQVIYDLRKKGKKISLDIYGHGEKEQEIRKIVSNFSDCVRLLPAFDYSNFKEIVSDYDLFIGSGSSIIEASSLGVVSIIGIESIDSALTYGFFSDFYKYEYNVKGLPFDLKSVEDVINNYFLLTSDQKKELSLKHIEASKYFQMSSCEEKIDTGYYMVAKYFNFNKYLYTLSKILFQIKLKLTKKTIYHDFI